MSNTFRKTYRPLTDEDKAYMDKVKTQAEALEALINELRAKQEYNTQERGRALSLGITKLEESVMWTIKAITA